MTASNQAVRHWERVFSQRQEQGEADWLATLRSEAFERFTAQGFPRAKSPNWRHTNVAPLARVAFEVDKGAAQPVDPSTLPALPGAAARLVFVDGHLREDLSTLPAVDGLNVASLREALSSGDGDLQELLRTGSPRPNGSFVALNTALMEDGAVVRVDRGAKIDGPIHLVFATTALGAPAATNLRNLVVAGALAEVTVVEHYMGPAGAACFTNVVTDVACGPGSQVLHARLQEEGDEAWHVAEVRAHVGRDAHLVSLSMASGARLSRTGIHAVLDGEGAQADLLGLYLGRAAQHHDHTTLIEHRAPHGTSREVYKGVLDDRARGVFTGMIEVAPGAQKTNATQSNRNLLLSDGAHADSEPMLEIHADDVKCAHGAAIGRLDDDALFYMRARGIGVAEAQRLLARAFAADVVEGIHDEGLAALVQERLTTWLDAARFGRDA